MARIFDGVDDTITTSLGAAGTTAWGSLTLAAIVRAGADGVLRGIFGVGNTNARPSLEVTAGNLISLRYSGASLSETLSLTVADGWCLVAATKAAGTTSARFHKYVFSTNTWSHENDTATRVEDTTAPVTSNILGARPGGAQFFNGSIAVAAGWRGSVLTDAQIESLAGSLRAWFQVQPSVLWLLDQDATTQKVNDLSGGGANESAVTGTAVGTSSVPVFSYGHEIMTTRNSVVALALAGILRV